MRSLHFPEPFKHRHPPVKNVNEIFEGQLTSGQEMADRLVNTVGSWKFIVMQSTFLVFWVILNTIAWIRHWDPYPFILMNVVLSLQAAYTGPIIMMSQRCQEARDRLEAHNDYLINQKAEEEIRAILEHLSAQDQALSLIYQVLLASQATSTGTGLGRRQAPLSEMLASFQNYHTSGEINCRVSDRDWVLKALWKPSMKMGRSITWTSVSRLPGLVVQRTCLTH